MMLVAYLGPETMLPVTSVLAGALGFIMMFGRKTLELGARLLRAKSATPLPTTRARGHRPTTSRTSATTASHSRNDAGPSDGEDHLAV